MISYKQSIKILNKSIIKIKDETIKTDKCLNRVAAENVKTKVDNPSGDNAAFDGFAINSKDTKYLSKKNYRLFKILGTIAAGDRPKIRKIKKFQTIEIMTGGLLPKGFNTIIPIEQIVFYPNKKNPKYILIDKKIIVNKINFCNSFQTLLQNNKSDFFVFEISTSFGLSQRDDFLTKFKQNL